MKHADLDDAKVVGVQRLPGLLVIDLQRSKTERIQVRAVRVSKEEAEYYVGERVTAPHPDPTLPLDQIEVAELEGGVLEMQGCRKNDSWYVWRIEAESIQIIRSGHAQKRT